MSMVRFQISISLDGYSAGPEQSEENPLGVGGEVNASTPVMEQAQANVGATVMGRKMFGGGSGHWKEDPPWKGWWGENPPFHTPVFVLTHHEREPLEMEGGTTFFFATDGIEATLKQAEEAAGGMDVMISGGASVIQQYLAAGLVDEFWVHITPIILGAGERLLENVGDVQVDQMQAIDAPGVTHIKYRVVK